MKDTLTLKKILYNFYLVTITFIFIFQPPITSRLNYAILYFIFLIVLIIFDPEFFRSLKYFIIEFLLFFLLLMISSVHDAYSGRDVYFGRVFLFVFSCYLLPVILASEIIKTSSSSLDLGLPLKLLRYFGLISSIVTLSLLFSPELNDFYLSLLSTSANVELDSISTVLLRGFGLSENLTFGFSLVLGVSCGLWLLSRNSIYGYFAALLHIVAIIVNARIGFVSMFMILLLNNYGIAILMRFSVFVALLVFVAIMYIDYSQFELHVDWLFMGISDLYYLIGDPSKVSPDGTIADLTSNMIFFPSDWSSLIFGSGINVFLGSNQGSSDIGYITQIHYGGFLMLSVLLILYSYCAIRISRAFGFTPWAFFILLTYILIVNFKGSIISSIPITRLLFILYFLYMLMKFQRHRRQL